MLCSVRQAAGLAPDVLQAFGGRLDVSVERAVCQLLLGCLDEAEATLGLAPGAAAAPDPGILQFVLVRDQCFAECPLTCQFDRLSDELCQSLDRLSDHFAKHWLTVSCTGRSRT